MAAALLRRPKELRARDDDGGESIATAIFSYRTTSNISKHELKRM